MLALVLALTVQAGDLSFGYVPAPGPGENPALLITPTRDVAHLWVECEVGGTSFEFEETNVPGAVEARFEWPRDPAVTEARCAIVADFSDSAREEVVVPIQYSYATPLSVDLTAATADLKARTLTVKVTASVERADITAYGARKKQLDKRTVEIGSGPGEIEVPWVGDAGDVVLLDVTLHSGGGWAGFTYSPWFLDIPHDDVHFESNQDTIRPEEEPKLQATLTQLAEVIDQYGSVVPVKLYIAGCTDTVGDSGHNNDLSRRRARAIASWLRSHGFSAPIYYWGFGETLPAVPTSDGVDEARNRRALYMVGANPPPAGSGIPHVGWMKL